MTALPWQCPKGVTSPINGRTNPAKLEDAAKPFAVTITDDDIAYLEEPYIPHRIVGAVDHNLADGVMLLDEKK